MVARATRAGRIVAALVALEGVWLLACEGLRERAPTVLAVFLLGGPWTVAVLAWLVVLPRGPRTGLVVATLLFALDVALDLWIPYQRRFVFAPWQIARALAIALATLAAVRQATPSRAATTALAFVRAVTLSGAVLLFGAMAVIARIGVRDGTQPADAALVLGFHLDPDGRAPPSLVARVAHATDLWHRHFVPRLVLSGGGDDDAPTEADAMRSLALAAGVPDGALVLERRSHSTVENFAFSAPILRSLDAHRVLVVTEPFHEARAMILAHRFALDAVPSPALDSPAWRNPRAATYWLLRDAMLYVVEVARDPFTGPSAAR